MDLAHILGNPAFGGVIGGSLVLSVLYAIKGVPGVLWDLFVWRCTSSLTVFNDDAAFDVVNDWISSLAYARSARQLRMTSAYSDHERAEVASVSVGMGKHLIFHNGRPFLVERNVPKETTAAGAHTNKRREDIIIRTPGLSSAPMRSLLAEMLDARQGAARTHIEIHTFVGGFWRLACRKQKRPMESVFLPSDVKDAIVDDLAAFYGAREWYATMGIPYRRGTLLYGPPGCGKTSLVLALASHFSRRIYALNMGSLSGDDALIEAITTVPENAFLLIEDIDAVQVTRESSNKPTKRSPDSEDSHDKRAISLSALLNSIDGAFSRDGRVLFMTTNFADRIDPALRRPGRSDRIFVVDMLGEDLAMDMCKRFVGSDAASVANALPATIAAAELQERLVEWTMARKRWTESAPGVTTTGVVDREDP